MLCNFAIHYSSCLKTYISGDWTRHFIAPKNITANKPILSFFDLITPCWIICRDSIGLCICLKFHILLSKLFCLSLPNEKIFLFQSGNICQCDLSSTSYSIHNWTSLLLGIKEFVLQKVMLVWKSWMCKLSLRLCWANVKMFRYVQMT